MKTPAVTPKPPQPAPSHQLEMVLAFVFGVIAIGVVLWLAFRSNAISEQQFEILRILIALAGGGVAAVIPGFLDVSIKPTAKLALRAGGALAVFVVLYFWSPAHWTSPPAGPAAHETGTVIQQTNGTDSPAQNGNGNTVINTGKP